LQAYIYFFPSKVYHEGLSPGVGPNTIINLPSDEEEEEQEDLVKPST